MNRDYASAELTAITGTPNQWQVEVLPRVWVWLEQRPNLFHRTMFRLLFGWRFVRIDE